MSYFLTVQGGGCWSDVDGVRYRGGPVEVTREVASSARATGYAWLVVTETDDPNAAPAPDESDRTGPLTIQDLQASGADAPAEPAAVDEPPLAEELTRNANGRIPCPVEGCDKDYAQTETLERHLETKHANASEPVVDD